VPERTAIFDREISLLESREFERIVSEISDSPGQSVFFCNVHMLMLSQEDRDLASAMNKADWVFADGVPVAWLQRRLSGKNCNVIRGYEIMLAVCERAATLGEKVGFIGSTRDVMSGLVNNLCARFEGLPVAYQSCPPFMQGELISTQTDLQAINDSGIKWLFVGLGCPKQEKWIANYKSRLDCHVLGVGAAFDWISGVVRKPPEWMEKYSLAWLHRLLNNPVKMGHRYLKYNTKFILRSSAVVFGRK